MIYPSQKNFSLQGFYAKLPFPFFIGIPLRKVGGIVCCRSQVIKGLCAWKHSPCSELSVIGWEATSCSGSHKCCLVFGNGIEGMKLVQGHNNSSKLEKGRRKGESSKMSILFMKVRAQA